MRDREEGVSLRDAAHAQTCARAHDARSSISSSSSSSSSARFVFAAFFAGATQRFGFAGTGAPAAIAALTAHAYSDFARSTRTFFARLLSARSSSAF